MSPGVQRGMAVTVRLAVSITWGGYATHPCPGFVGVPFLPTAVAREEMPMLTQFVLRVISRLGGLVIWLLYPLPR